MSEIQHFSQQDIEILGEQTLYEGFFTLKRIQFKHKLFAGGQSGVVTRELLIKVPPQRLSLMIQKKIL